ncbi:MAG: hypothetical protein PUP46_02940 [Endozoicomonas sp. (ex Botrylloides leachii)]|nr:hypothetical protein [Endozoicomonas sp. (ex Botrylloides leachii)]
MLIDNQEYLTRLLFEYTEQTDHNLMMEMLVSAQKGLTSGASNFADKASYVTQPKDLMGYLKCYPLAHALLALTQFNELNKNTEVTRNILKLFLDSLDNPEKAKSDSASENAFNYASHAEETVN